MNPTNFHFSKHAGHRSAQRKITKEIFMEVVTKNARKHQQYKGTHNGWVWRFEKEIEGKLITIVAEIDGDDCYFITCF